MCVSGMGEEEEDVGEGVISPSPLTLLLSGLTVLDSEDEAIPTVGKSPVGVLVSVTGEAFLSALLALLEALLPSVCVCVCVYV